MTTSGNEKLKNRPDLVTWAQTKARENIKNPSVFVLLRQYFTSKYRLPATSPLFKEFTLEELLIDLYEDLFRAHPVEMLKSRAGKDGQVVFANTGDALIDKWEREIAEGKTPDLDEGQDDVQKNRDDYVKGVAAALEKEMGRVVAVSPAMIESYKGDAPVQKNDGAASGSLELLEEIGENTDTKPVDLSEFLDLDENDG